jgi:hypothetical protein
MKGIEHGHLSRAVLGRAQQKLADCRFLAIREPIRPLDLGDREQLPFPTAEFADKARVKRFGANAAWWTIMILAHCLLWPLQCALSGSGKTAKRSR